MVKAVQVNTLKHDVMNVDLQRVGQEDRVSISVSIVLEGEPEAVRLGGVLEQLMHSVNLRCRVANVPTQITHDVSELQIGETLQAGQLALPLECELLDKGDDLIAVIGAPTVPILEETVVVEPDISGPGVGRWKAKRRFPTGTLMARRQDVRDDEGVKRRGEETPPYPRNRGGEDVVSYRAGAAENSCARAG